MGGRIGESVTATQRFPSTASSPETLQARRSQPSDPARLDVAAFLTARRLPRPDRWSRPGPNKAAAPPPSSSSANTQRHKPPPPSLPFRSKNPESRGREQRRRGGGVRASPCLASFKRSALLGGDSAMATRNHRAAAAAAPQPANRGQRSESWPFCCA